MEIGILEYHYHWEYVETLKKICSDHDITVFNNIKDAKKKSKNLDLLFVNTIQPVPWDISKWITFKPKCKSILTIHEANTDFRFLKVLFKKFDALSVPFLPMKDYILKEKNYKGKLFTLPYAIHEKVYPNKNCLRVVPGKIEEFRRDYDLFFRTLTKSQKWCLLGEPIGTYGHKVMLQCIDHNDRGFDIKFYSKHVPTEEYNDILKNCNSIFAPLKNPTVGTNKLCKEIYGKTKICGAYFEAVKYGKLFICNQPIELSYKDYLFKDWKKYFNEVVLEELNW